MMMVGRMTVVMTRIVKMMMMMVRVMVTKKLFMTLVTDTVENLDLSPLNLKPGRHGHIC